MAVFAATAFFSGAAACAWLVAKKGSTSREKLINVKNGRRIVSKKNSKKFSPPGIILRSER
jgi:hypothetical protein